jgi:hypothetical protein
MALDLFKNFAKVQVSTGYDDTATSVVLSGGHGTKLPAAPFNATWWNSTDFADPSDDPNVEIVRVTAIASDTLTVTRAQESTSASTKNTASKTYRMIAGLTAKTFNTDITALSIGVANGRLTLESGVPISSTDQTAKTTVYYTPYQGNRISLYNGTMWYPHNFSELSVPLGTLAANTNYDVFIYDNAGTPTLELGTAWASDTARTDALALQDGIEVKSGAATRRYAGTFRTTSTTTTEDSITKRLLWNVTNRIPRLLNKTDTTTHTYNGGMRYWNGNTANEAHFVTGKAENVITATLTHHGDTSNGVHNIATMGFDDAANGYLGLSVFLTTTAATVTTAGMLYGAFTLPPQIGFHRLMLLQTTGSSGSSNFISIRVNAQISC